MSYQEMLRHVKSLGENRDNLKTFIETFGDTEDPERKVEMERMLRDLKEMHDLAVGAVEEI